MSFETPRKEDPLSVELQKVIAERNILSNRSKDKVLSALHEIHGPESHRRSLRSKAIQEILSSELSYIKQLEKIMKYFMEPISKRRLMTNQQFTTVFGHVETVYRVAGELVCELRKCDEESFAPAFVKLAPFLKMYSLYACGYHRAISTLQDLRSGRAGMTLNTFLKDQECRPEVACSLQSLLITPVQRLPRYRLLLREVSTHTEPNDPQQSELQEALKGIEASAAHVDSLLSIQERQTRLVQLQQSLTHGWPQVLCPGRCFLAEGNFFKVLKCGTKAVPVQLIMLTDMFLCCRVKSGNMLECRHAFPLIRCSVDTVLGKAVFKVLCGTETLLLFAKNQDEGEAWTMAMIKSIEELKSSQMTLRRTSVKKRIPKRLEDLEEASNVNHRKGGFLFGRKRSAQGSPGTHKCKKNRMDLSMSPLSPPRDSLYPLRASMKEKEDSRYHLRRLRRPSRLTIDSNAPDLEGNKSTLKHDKHMPAITQQHETPSSVWTPQYCVQMVRNVVNSIKSVFNLRFPY